MYYCCEAGLHLSLHWFPYCFTSHNKAGVFEDCGESILHQLQILSLEYFFSELLFVDCNQAIYIAMFLLSSQLKHFFLLSLPLSLSLAAVFQRLMRSARNYAYKHSGLIISHNISDNVINKHCKINERNCDLQNI